MWRAAARATAQQGESLSLNGGPIVATDAAIQSLRQDLRTQKQKLIGQDLRMTESEAVKFWAVYSRYAKDLKQIDDEKFRLDEALIYIRPWLEVDEQVHQLRSKYVMNVSQALPGKKAPTFFQLDRRISMMIDIQLASQMPIAISQDRPWTAFSDR